MQHDDIIRAGELQIVDSHGRTRIRLSCAEGEGPRILLTDENGMARIALTVEEDGSPSIMIQDRDAFPRYIITLLEDGRLMVSPVDTEGRAVPGALSNVLPPNAP